MNALVLYDSKFGNTERIAETIALALQEAVPTRLASVGEIEDCVAALADVDLLVVGGPTQRHGISPDLKAMVGCLDAGSLDGKRAATFDTRMGGPRVVTGSAALRLSRLLRRRGAWLVVPPASFVVEGTEGPLERGEREHAVTWAREVLRAIGIRTTRDRRAPAARA
jgi:flavodoxin I